MSLGRFLLGVALLAAMVVPVALGARRLRRRVLPSWSGAPAWLADTILALALLLGMAQVLGSVGLFRRGALVAGAAVTGLAAAVWHRRPMPGHKGEGRPASSGGGIRSVWGDDVAGRPAAVPSVGVFGRVATVGVVALVAAEWATRTAAAVAGGITEYDSLNYHLSFAARFVQEGWVTRLHFTMPEFPVAFHPANGELLHGMGMALFGRDTLSPLVNMGWLALAFLAAWCAGRPSGRGPAAVLVLGVLLSTPVLAIQAGTAKTDVAGLALLLAAAALLLQPGGGRAGVGVAGAAAGLAIGVKLTLLAPVAALTAGVVAVAGRGARRATALAWSAPLLVTGSFWYLRNLARAGTPLAGLSLGVGPVALPRPHFALVERFGFSVARYATDLDVWRHWFLPGLSVTFGRVWWLVLALAGAGVLIALGPLRPSTVRMLGVVAGVAAVAYTVTPTSAMGREGAPVLFISNLRYLAPALALALVLVPLALGTARWSRAGPAASAVAVAALLATHTSRRGEPAWPDGGSRAVGLAVGLAVLATGAGVLARQGRRPSRAIVAAALAGVVVVGLSGGYAVQRYAARHRYAADSLGRWGRDRHDQRVAVGFDRQYLFYGTDLSNHVQRVGRHGPHGEFHAAAGCDEWRRLLRRGRYRWVALYAGAREDTWTRSDPAATEVLRAESAVVFRFDWHRPAGQCARGA